MHNPTTATTILLVPGSLRAASVNRAVLRTAARLAGDAIEATLYEPVSALPPFNPDDDPEAGPAPASVAELRRRLAATDAVLFCVPEYAGTMPGAFKNLLDWAVGGGELDGKPVAWINASSRLNPEAGRGAHQALRTVLGYTGADIAETACRRIRVPRRAVGPDGLVADEATRQQIAAVVRALAGHASAARTSNGFRPAA
jgi:chromate reductase, NAD(P)H dehydrogenase (quinone)